MRGDLNASAEAPPPKLSAYWLPSMSCLMLPYFSFFTAVVGPTCRPDERCAVNAKDRREFAIPATPVYVIFALLGLGMLAFAWREAPAIIRYVKSEML